MGTLAQAKKRPATQMLPLATIRVPELVKQYHILEKFLSSEDVLHKIPEKEAIEFYMYNSAVHSVMKACEPTAQLSPEMQAIVDKYYDNMAVSVPRMFWYMLMICTRESRHCKTGPDLVVKGLKEFGACDFWMSIRGSGSSGAANRLVTHAPDTTLGAYTTHLVKIFNLFFYSSGYGGKAWGKVAECLNSFVQGETTAEMFMDTAFTLAHNNGPIFNKGMLFSNYTSELAKILDVQRAGMIGTYVRTVVKSVGVTEDVRKAEKGIRSIFPDFSKEVIDWKEVKALGALHDYSESEGKKKKTTKVPSPAAASSGSVLQISTTDQVTKITRKEVHNE